MRIAALFAAAAMFCSAADFSVQDHDRTVIVSPAKASATVVIFVSAVCPISDSYVDRVNNLIQTYSSRGVQFALVNSNITEQRTEIDEHAKAIQLKAPVYTDPLNTLANQLKAEMTPETFVFDKAGTLRYHGRIDDAVNPARVKSHDLREVLEALLAGRMEPVLRETKAFGCTIKRRRA